MLLWYRCMALVITEITSAEAFLAEAAASTSRSFQEVGHRLVCLLENPYQITGKSRILFCIIETGGFATIADTTSSSDAVHIVIDTLGQFVIYDVPHIWDICRDRDTGQLLEWINGCWNIFVWNIDQVTIVYRPSLFLRFQSLSLYYGHTIAIIEMV